MPRLKVDDDELDLDELEEAEYEERADPYTGPKPPKGTLLYGYVKRAWWTYNSNDVRMITVLFEATEESGKYKTMGVWDRLTLSAAAKFRWQPFLDAAGITLADVKKKMIVESEDENQGRPIKKIGSFVIGDEEKSAICIITGTELYNDERQVKVDKWLPWRDPDADEDDEDDDFEDELEEDEDEEPEPAPKRRAAAAKSATPSKAGAAKRRRAPELDDEVEDDEELEEDYEPDDEEEEEQPAKPARKASARPAARATAAKPARPVARSSRSASATPARSGRVAKATSKKGRPSSAGYDEEPPF